MNTGLSMRLAAAALLALSMSPVSADPLLTPAAMSVDSLRVILTAGASQCDTSCMTSYDSCVSTGLAAQVVADDEVVYEECSAKLVGCRDVCINRGACITDNSGFVLCP
ncbi:hypothetical protein [Antarctobacter sp.]|uniref:hypothetical protein n=1 Tax=Antarctobacter sp. TaxID=1872577 RepID=UPI002B270EA6|nr:hypothetical protein [Antarctobacter sp.]